MEEGLSSSYVKVAGPEKENSRIAVLTTASIIIEPFPPLQVSSCQQQPGEALSPHSLEDTPSKTVGKLRNDASDKVGQFPWISVAPVGQVAETTHETKNMETPIEP
jgi:hypothetical protein